MTQKRESTAVRHAKIYKRYLELIGQNKLTCMQIYERTANGYYSTYHVINVIRSIRKNREYKKLIIDIIGQLKYDE